MANPNFGFFMAHGCGALSIMLGTLYLIGFGAMWPVVVVILAGAVVKEFWYDLKFEIPKQSFEDSLLDFAGYLTGTTVGVGIGFLAHGVLGR